MPVCPQNNCVVELSYPKLVADNFFGISGPADLPRPVVEAIHKATMSALDDPKLVQEIVPLRFTMIDPREHYHLPVKITPWGLGLARRMTSTGR